MSADYPSRVAWQFHNVTRGHDFWPTLDSIGITEGHIQDIAVMSGTVVDGSGTIEFDVEDEVWCKIGGEFAFGGHIKTCVMSLRSEVGPRAWELSAQDYTAKLDDSVIDHPKTRGSESLADRVDWILTFLSYPITSGSLDLPSVDVDKADYDGMTVREALDQVADDQRLFYYVDFEKALHMFRTETLSAPFDLDDTTPDFAERFPYSQWSHSRDSVELANAAYVQGEKRQTWVTDSPSIASYGRQERSVSDGELVTLTQRENAGARANAELAQPQIDGSLLCHEPGLRAGMRFLLTEGEFGFDEEAFLVTVVELEAVDPLDDAGEAYLHTTVTYSDRRRARPYKNRRPRGSASLTDGDALEYVRACLSANRNLIGYDGTTANVPLPDDVSYGSPVPPAHADAAEVAPSYRRPYIFASCPPAFQGGWSGHLREEQWLEVEVGSLSGVASVRVTYTTSGLKFAAGKQLEFGIAHAAPTAEFQYEVLGYCSVDGGSFDVPASVLEASATNYISLAPADLAPQYVETCDGALADGLGGPLGSTGAGEYNSWALLVGITSVVERVVDGSGLTPWVSPVGAIDGSNRVFDLPDWSGKGVPEIRIGGIVYAVGTDYDYDEDAGTVTLSSAPWVGAALEGRWRT